MPAAQEARLNKNPGAARPPALPAPRDGERALAGGVKAKRHKGLWEAALARCKDVDIRVTSK
jgi:hypothetical protein